MRYAPQTSATSTAARSRSGRLTSQSGAPSTRRRDPINGRNIGKGLAARERHERGGRLDGWQWPLRPRPLRKKLRLDLHGRREPARLERVHAPARVQPAPPAGAARH
eukprot:7286032-Prymnesium_polylepis.1